MSVRADGKHIAGGGLNRTEPSLPQQRLRRAGDPAILIASSEGINHDLDWKPQYPQLKTIIETAWNWHQAHPNGYKK